MSKYFGILQTCKIHAIFLKKTCKNILNFLCKNNSQITIGVFGHMKKIIFFIILLLFYIFLGFVWEKPIF